MTATLFLSFVLLYFFLLILVAWYTSRNANNDSFYIGNKNSNWFLVAFGMIGTSLSGITFISIPGAVSDWAGDHFKGFAYMQVVVGYLIGYVVVALILLPLYYKLNLTSIYTYLKDRFGTVAYKTSAAFFLLSRTVGATARVYIVINILQIFILNQLGIPFIVTTAIILLMILIYTYRGGVKTIVYTDTIQTFFMLAGLILCVVYILNSLSLSPIDAYQQLNQGGYLQVFNTDIKSKGFFLKQIVGGMFITIAMTGLDQEMMQKNISIRTLKDAQKNVFTLSITLFFVILLFLFLGGLLYLFATHKGAFYELNNADNKAQYLLTLNNKNIAGDSLFPTLVFQYFPVGVGIIFLIALISALFPSADGALTALTSSFCIDILGLNQSPKISAQRQKKIRHIVHLSFTLLFLICIAGFYILNKRSIIDTILDLAGYTYGPLLGIFSFGIFTKRQLPNSIWISIICILSPIFSYLLSRNSPVWFNGFSIGIELLVINGILTFIGLWAISKRNSLAEGSKN